MDLILARPQQGDLIFQNNSDGSFKEITDSVDGLSLGKSVSIVFSDLDNDNDLEAIQLTTAGEIKIFENLREVRFKKAVEFSLPVTKGKSLYLLCKDFNNDGRMDFTVIGRASAGCLVWMVDENWNVQPLRPYSLRLDGSVLGTVFDANNDGFEDCLLLPGDPSNLPRLLLNQYPKPFKIAANEAAQNAKGAVKALPVDIDFDGDLDLLAVTGAGDLLPLENQGGDNNQSITLRILGKKNSTFGYGSKILVKDGLFRMKKEVTSSATHLGMGDRNQLDVLRVTWPNGIFQNVIHATAQIFSVTEKPGYAGSCPFIYTWNGDRFEFVSDALCTSPLGLYLGGGSYFEPDPDEYARIRGDQLRERDGVLEMRITEDLREITYLDDLELISVTHPAGLEVIANECFTTPPFPEFKLFGISENARPPKKVVDNNGNDVTELISKNDLRYPRPFGPSRYDGVGEEHWFEIDLGDVGNAKTIYLFITGYLDWPNSSIARSLDQNPSLDFVMPYLQVKNKDGEWETVLNPIGFPAGKLKTTPLDLSNVFLTEDRSIRIVTTLKIHWDRILVDTSPIIGGFDIRQHQMISADLRNGGFSKSYLLTDAGPRWYDYSKRTSNLRWDYSTGFYTRFGDVYHF